MMRHAAVGLAALALAAGLTACGSSGSGSGGSSSQPPATQSSTSASGTGAPSASGGSDASTGSGGAAAKAVTVEVKNFSFEPGDVTVAKGGTVTWKFEDSTQHNVTASDNKFKSKDIQSGSYKNTFNTAGSYNYICTIHQYMKGTVTVK